MWPFAKRPKHKFNTLTEALRRGTELGFNAARKYPERSCEEFMADIDHLQEQLKGKSTKELNRIIEALDKEHS